MNRREAPRTSHPRGPYLLPLVFGGLLVVALADSPATLLARFPSVAARLPLALPVNLGLALVAGGLGAITVPGVLVGTVLGAGLWALAGWRAFLLLVLFSIMGMAATRLGYARKASRGIAQARGGRRGAGHVVANAGAGLLFAILAVSDPVRAPLYLLAVAAAYATAAADTVSSEMGRAFGGSAVLVTTFRRVPHGTGGAISLEGSLAGLVASVILAASARWAGCVAGWSGMAVVVAAAFVGTTAESYLGATLERAGLIDHDTVNLLNTFVGGLTAILLAHLLLPLP